MLKERCTKCHSLVQVESAKKTETEWTDTVQRMVTMGDTLTKEEQSAVVQYSSLTYPQ